MNISGIIIAIVLIIIAIIFVEELGKGDFFTHQTEKFEKNIDGAVKYHPGVNSNIKIREIPAEDS